MYKWEEQCWYLVEVSYSKGNPVHRALFFTGFLNGDGTPGGYNMIVSHRYENESFSFKDTYYFKVIKKIVDSKELKIPIELPGDRE